MRWGENVLGNPETFFARMHIGYKEKHYGRGQCHDHVDVYMYVKAWVFRVHGALFPQDRYNATVLSRPARIAVPRGRNFFNGVASSCSYKRVTKE